MQGGFDNPKLKFMVWYRYGILEGIAWCLAPESQENEAGARLGLSDLIMEETLLLLGEIEMPFDEGKKQFPLTCDAHGIQPAYVVCVHVFRSEAKANVIQNASMENIGVIACTACRDEASDDETTDIDGWRCVCAECCLQNGWTSGGIQ